MVFFDEEEVGRCPILNSYFIKLAKTATGGILEKKMFLKISQYSQKKHLPWSLFLIKLPVFRPAALLERDPNTGVFLLRNF